MSPRSSSRPQRVVHVVGAGLPALLVAEALSRAPVEVTLRCRIYGDQVLGSACDPTAATPRCQAWLHAGTIYAQTQPAVAVGIRASALQLARLAPHAVHDELLALAIEPPAGSSGVLPLDEAMAALGLPCRRISFAVAKCWLPSLGPTEGARYYRVADSVMILPLLGAAASAQAQAAGAELVRSKVTQLVAAGSRVGALQLRDGTRVPVGPHDIVVLACGAGISPLLAQLGFPSPLRHFQSHLVAAEGIPLHILAAVVRGGANAVPHVLPDGRPVAVFGNSHRTPLPSEWHGRPLPCDDAAVADVVADAERCFGIRIDAARARAWPAVKTEFVPDGSDRSQAHHVAQVRELANTWLLVPGKLSNAWGAAQELTRLLLRETVSDSVARSIWDGSVALRGRRPRRMSRSA